MLLSMCLGLRYPLALRPGVQPVAEASAASSRAVFDHIADPVLNTPYEPTARCWKIGEDNRAMAQVEHMRRPSIGILSVPTSRRDALGQQELQLSPEDYNDTVNEIRARAAGMACR